jgi:hypothetical protein
VKNQTALVGLALALLAEHASAYEILTHRRITAKAFDDSVLVAQPRVLAELGIAPSAIFPSTRGTTESMALLLESGAEAEDDGARPIHHFYDPYSDEGLRYIPLAQPSPDWILRQPSLGVQQYAYDMALSYFTQALTSSDNATRSMYWGSLFETLGHVVHHIQDMAQPQHVRGDPHFHRNWPIVGDRSLYEFCTDDAVKNLPTGCGAPLSVARYNVVALGTARNYWTTRQTDIYGSRRGLADFTNANFVSKDTNFRLIDDRLVLRSAEYPKPVPTGFHTRTLEELGVADVCERLRRDPKTFGRAGSCEIEFYSTEVHDAYTGTTAINERASSLSVFDQYLDLRPDGPTYRTDRLFTLNRYNYAAAHPFLISRAIGYSAGLIDHFFRGRIELQEAKSSDGQLRIEIKNISAESNAFGPGTFSLYYDSADGQRKALTIAEGADLGMQQFAPGQAHVLTAQVPDDVDLKVDRPFVVVYSGIVGAEEAVSGLVFEAPALHEGFLFQANGALADGQGENRLLYYAGGQWRLYPQGNVPRAGGLDWKGWYSDGKATRVLTWGGSGRYSAQQVTSFGSQIYQGGKLFAVTPGPVLGTALQRGADGEAWIVAICAIGEKDVAFKRPAKRSTSAALYDGQSAPDGWQYLGEFQSTELRPERAPWLFNGAGTEAQTMRHRKLAEGSDELGPLTRLKASISGNAAQFADAGNTVVTQTSRVRESYQCDQPSPRSASAWRQFEIRGSHIVAADYVDDREVLARIVVDSLIETNETADLVWESRNTFEESYRLDDYRATRSRSEETAWTLDLGANTVPLYKNTGSSVTTYRSYYETGKEPVSTRQTDAEWNAVGANLLFWDLRAGAWLSATGHVHDEVSVTRNNETQTETGNKRGHFVRELAHGGAPVELNRTPVVEQPYTRTMTTGVWVLEGTLAQTCYQHDGVLQSHSGERSGEIPVTFATTPRLSYPANMNVFSLAAAAIDRRGNLFWSLRYRDGVGQPYRRISRIGQLNVDSVTGLGAADPLEPPYSEIVPN